MHVFNFNPTQWLKRALIIFTFISFSLGSTPLYGQNDLLKEIKALAKVKKGLKFDPAAMPANANPYLSLLPPGAKRDYRAWQNYYQRKAQYNRLSQSLSTNGSQNSAKKPVLRIREKEKKPGQNDTQKKGEKIGRFGAGKDKMNRVIVRGISGEKNQDFQYKPGTATENDGSIPLANATGIKKTFDGKQYQAFIGDGPVSSLSDFDFYKVKGKSGQTLSIDVNTPDPFADLDPFVSVFDENGVLLDFNDDDGESLDSKLLFNLPFDGTFYVCVGGFGAFVPLDPFDAESGSVTGEIGSEGEYELLLALFDFLDIDFYVFNLKKGDILAAAIKSQETETLLTVHSPNKKLEVGTIFQTTFIYPLESPLSLAGNTSVYYIAEKDGKYAVSVANNYRDYKLELFVTRPNLEKEGGTQIVFLDFDGGEFDVNAFFGIPGSDVRQLSPFRDFLGNWRISDDPLTVFKLTNRITSVVTENLKRDLSNSKINPNFNVVIIGNTGLDNNFTGTSLSTPSILNLQSEDFNAGNKYHGLDDPTSALFGELEFQTDLANSVYPISRVIVGGTIEESGIGTIGIAQSIDPGNFATEETALVLLDILSAPRAGDPSSFSLNDIPLARGTTIEDLVVTALGNIISHEVGHCLGNWHTDGFDNTQTLMDEGAGGIFSLIGMNPNGRFGDHLTIDVDFKTDAYSASESFFGNENTKNQTAWGLSSHPDDVDDQLIVQSNQTTGARLSQTYPNPATLDQVLSIDFKVEEKGPVQLEVYNTYGEKVAVLFNDIAEPEREYRVNFDPSYYRLKSGTYIYRISNEKGIISKRMHLKN